MAIRTKEEYIENLRKQKPKVYMEGEEIKNIVDHPAFKVGINSASMTYELSNNPKYQDEAAVVSPIINEKISRWTHLMRNRDDAVAKVKLMRGFDDYLSPCCYRCITGDALHAVWAITEAIDAKYHTHYHSNAVNLVKNVQKNDWILGAAATDPKGDRSKGPNAQADPDLYLHVVEKKRDGIVVRGARPHGTATAYSDMLIVFGTVPPDESAKDYSFAFFTPVDTEGITFICRPPSIPSEPKELENPLSSRFGHVETLTIYDNVFIPWEQVLMCGEYEFSLPLLKMFRASHTWHKCMCRWASMNLSIGAAALIADYNGMKNAPHIWENLSDMVMSSEIVYSLALAAAMDGWVHESGVYFPNASLAATGKYFASKKLVEDRLYMLDAAGGAAATMPSEKDYRSPITGKYMEKYFKGREGVPTEHRIRAMKLIEDLVGSGYAGWYQAMAIIGGGPPLVHKKTVMENYDFEKSKRKAMGAAGIRPI